MPRHFPDPPNWDEPQKREEIKLTLKVVTPMFGGGYKAREVDPICVIRPAAIRGHLRFWWRATAGATFPSPEELFKAEKEIWGSMENPGKVTLRVEDVKSDSKLVRLDKADVPDYVRAILIQEKTETEKRIDDQKRQNGWSKERVKQELKKHAADIERERDVLFPFVLEPPIEFVLRISFDGSLATDIVKVMKAFILFGGVGGRSRRGHGCLDLGNVLENPSVGKLRNEKLEIDKPFFGNATNPPPGCASLAQARLFVSPTPSENIQSAWNSSVQMFEQFRKAELPDQNRPYKGVGSHSTWPEADMIRKMSSSSSGPSFAFPRAQLGLPLAFKSTPNQWGFFGEAELSLKIGDADTSRLASPVIVKPIKLNGTWHGAILILNATPIRAGDLRVSTNKSVNLTVDSTNAPASLWDGSTEQSFSHSYSNVLDVLAEYLQTKAGWKQQEIDKL